jgi:UDP-N-acetylglucosamine transferase subunit ALG13
MIFLTVGTLFPFDRLVKAVDITIAKNNGYEKVFAQIGKTNYEPKNFEYTAILENRDFAKKISDADYLISHAGIGTITMALELNKPLLVMPRRKKFKEHVNDHQLATARKFEELGHVLVAYTEEELAEKIKQLKFFVPQPRKVQAQAVVDRIAGFLNGLQ